MSFTPQNLCGFLIRSRLMTPEEMRNMYDRWRGEAKENQNSLSHFTKWLVANQYVTAFQAEQLAKGHGDPDVFFLGQYKIMERLGRGRMAGVYRAVHTLGQTVAIKVLPPSRAKNPQMLGRFQREARLAIRLKDPNVVRSFQVGESNGIHYLVMEFLEGETVEEVLRRRKRLPPSEAVRLVYQALTGLQHIQEQGMVHRDLKPSNMMLVPAPSRADGDSTLRSTLKILDIGLGRAMFDDDAADGEEKMELTGEGVILGTPDYLAPEQARDPRTIDVRADIYSLGCVLYHLLTGQPPFPDTNLINQMVRHATENPKPLQQFNAAIPDGLQQIVNYMMAKQPAQRYPSPERAAQALQMFLVAESEAPKPVEEAPQMRKFLTWLESATPGEPEAAPAAPAPKPPSHPAVPVAAAPVTPKPPSQPGVPVATPAVNVPVAKAAVKAPARPDQAPAGRMAAGKKQKRPRPAQPESPAEQPEPEIHAEEFDVELVALPGAAPGGNKKTLGLTRREWVLVGIGAGALTLIILLGVAIASLLS